MEHKEKKVLSRNLFGSVRRWCYSWCGHTCVCNKISEQETWFQQVKIDAQMLGNCGSVVSVKRTSGKVVQMVVGTMHNPFDREQKRTNANAYM